MEEGDGKPAVFWTYFVEALRRAGVPLFPALADPLHLAAVDESFLPRLAEQLAALARPVSLVLDEVSSVVGQQWANDLDFVLRHSAGGLRLTLVGRWDPPLPLYRYRLAGTLSEVRGEDLVFTEDEGAELLALHGIVLSSTGLTSLLRHTEGWAAGLRLFAMALEGHAEAESLLATINGDEATIAEYFVSEVLRARPPELRDFLLRSSIVDIVTPELAQLLTGRRDAGRVLAGLERENSFLQVVNDQPVAYRYHRLFGELLRAELAHDDPDEISSLHRRAAGWLAAEGRTVDAVHHAVSAGDWETAAEITIDDYAVGQLVLGGTQDRLGPMFRDLPEVGDSPEVALVRAALALAAADHDRAAKQLALAEELVADRSPERRNALSVAGAVLDLLVTGAAQDASRWLDTAHLATFLLGNAPAERLARHPELRALVLAATGTAQSWLGAVEAAVAPLSEAADVATADGCEAVRVDCLQDLALIEAYRGRLRHAAVLANQAIMLAERCNGVGVHPPASAHVALAWVAVEHYDVEAGWRFLRAAEPLCGLRAGGAAEAGIAIVKSRLLRGRGELRGALRVLQDAGGRSGSQSQPAWLAREVALSRARILTAGGHPEGALAAVAQLSDQSHPDVLITQAEALLAAGDPERARETLGRAVEDRDVAVPIAVNARLGVAALAAGSGDVRAAHDALQEALRLADPESLRRHFHEVGAGLRRMMREDEELAEKYRSLGRGGHPPHPQVAHGVGSVAETVMVEKLSKRELEVLRHVEAMLPTEEIAGAMYLSVNTVKTHVRSILRKLCASRRNEAVRRARELGLI
jgi:LuxR family maltose regulon positive regulatory protein